MIIRTGTICFDTDFPFLTRFLSSGDLLLESSATWSNIGFSAFWKVTQKRVNTKPLMSLSFNKQRKHVFSLHMFIVGFPPETGGSELIIFQSSVRDVCLADVTIPHMFSETRTPQQIIRDQHIQHPTIAISQFLLRRITYFFPSSNSLHMSLHTGFQGVTLALRKITGAGNITVLIGPSLKLTFDIAPENRWLEDEPFLLGFRPIFRRFCY